MRNGYYFDNLGRLWVVYDFYLSRAEVYCDQTMEWVRSHEFYDIYMDCGFKFECKL